MPNEEDVRRLLDKLTPEQRGVAQTLATLKVENAALKEQNKRLAADHRDLWKVLVVLLAYYRDVQGVTELRIHESQFKRFDEMYRIDRRTEGEEVVLRLLTIHDELPDGGGVVEDGVADDENVH